MKIEKSNYKKKLKNVCCDVILKCAMKQHCPSIGSNITNNSN